MAGDDQDGHNSSIDNNQSSCPLSISSQHRQLNLPQPQIADERSFSNSVEVTTPSKIEPYIDSSSCSSRPIDSACSGEVAKLPFDSVVGKEKACRLIKIKLHCGESPYERVFFSVARYATEVVGRSTHPSVSFSWIFNCFEGQ